MAFDPIERWNLTLSAGAVAASLALAPPVFAGSVAVGAALETINFRGLYRASQMLFQSEVPEGRRWSSGFGLRFALLAVGVAVALHVGADAIGLLIGLSLIIPASIIEAWRRRPPIDPDAPALDPESEEWDRWNPWIAREREEDPEEDEA